MVEQNQWSGFACGKPGVGGPAGGIWFKKVNYSLGFANTRPNQHVEHFWAIHKASDQSPIPTASTQSGWVRVIGKDIAGEGDVRHIPNWPASQTFEQLQQIVI